MIAKRCGAVAAGLLLDRLAGEPPALVAGAAPSRTREILTAVRQDAPTRPSPNAGVAEAAVAGALGRELGGPLRYGATVENRPRLGTGPRRTPADIPHAIAIAAKVEAIVVALLIVGWLVGTGRLSR